jgi:hypothetical protein
MREVPDAGEQAMTTTSSTLDETINRQTYGASAG